VGDELDEKGDLEPEASDEKMEWPPHRNIESRHWQQEEPTLQDIKNEIVRLASVYGPRHSRGFVGSTGLAEAVTATTENDARLWVFPARTNAKALLQRPCCAT
jgi:hypothetical protein